MWSSVMTGNVRASSPELANIQLNPPSTFDLSGPKSSSSDIAFISLHAGAGFLHPSKHREMEVLIQSAINSALQHSGTAEDAVAIALSVLESSPLTNAALGSCLTEDGRVECEASIVMGSGAMGSVGAVSGVDHAIQVAHRLAKERNDHGLIKELGRVRPISLVGEGAYRYARQLGLAVAPHDQIDQHNITPQTRAIWKHYKDKIDSYNHNRLRHGDRERLAAVTAGAREDEGIEPQGTSPSSTPDTVGAIACDYTGRVYAGTSSGGIWMKSAGRLGSSGIPGAGCYAVNGDLLPHDDSMKHDATGEASAAAAVSGCGEDIVEQFVAMRCCDMIRSSNAEASSSPEPSQTASSSSSSSSPMQQILRRLMVKEQVLRATMARVKKRRHNDSGSQDTLVEDGGLSTGIIALKVLRKTEREQLELHHSWAHTAHHFALGFAVGDDVGQRYEGQAWVSVQGEQAVQTSTMKAGEFHKVLYLASSRSPPATSPAQETEGGNKKQHLR